MMSREGFSFEAKLIASLILMLVGVGVLTLAIAIHSSTLVGAIISIPGWWLAWIGSLEWGSAWRLRKSILDKSGEQ